MTSVRLRLLIFALIPVIVLMPLLLFLSMSRWSMDYDNVLIANVESDLRIAEQYLARIVDDTGRDLAAAARSRAFARAMQDDIARDAWFETTREALNLDFLYFLPRSKMPEPWPVVQAALGGTSGSAIDIFAPEDLAQKGGLALAQRAEIPLIETEAAVPTDRAREDRGMVVHAASPVPVDVADGVLIGGALLNRNLQFIDTINALVYLNAVTGGDRHGTATLFLDDVRVSTNVRLFEDVRALGTRVSAAVRRAVLGEGQTWLDRAFVVNDWYISGYLPITDSRGDRVGMLYVGFQEAPFAAAKREAFVVVTVAFLAVIGLSAPLFLWLAKGIFWPLESMTHTMRQVAEGDLSARNGDVGSRDEIGQVAAHLDGLLDQIQDRDRELRGWAEDLNRRVEERTAALRDANAKLEETFRQLVVSEKLAAIGEITAGVAHEINNPVAVIQGNVDVIRDTIDVEAADLTTELALIDQQVLRIEAIVGKLLTFARPAEYADFADRVDLRPVVADCLFLVDHLMIKGRVEVRTDLVDVPPVCIDPGEMQQVVVNLVMNAVQAMDGRGRLDLILGPDLRDGQQGARLLVRDTGPGVPDDLLGAVFDPFFTTKQAEGTGLGLSISQTLIQRAGGLISARNVPDGGAEFAVWLPAADESSTLAAQ
ncbi:two-component sensor histidine kinase [Jannaschia pagri]|uniref:histidine kinase n=1 Tax=Jannaschia pagri TaxID=2829797 RepID=A0ABQ4NM39_9RHOB|nr:MULTISPECIES: cache domain-containing protein [unclassified Jannaschia]GIT91339.1 two-component sensor histidine kinase [Jannaschia sp. AI_61]GIT95172.1 two-component sensor histidine kinase [Jannaschia sp. AI_62]